MKKMIFFTLVAMLATLMLTSVGQSKQRRDCSKSEREVDAYLQKVEKSLPVFEKQAEVLIKLLNSDKHRAKMINDLDKIIDNYSAPGASTHIYKAMKSFKLEKELLFELGDRTDMPFYNTEFLKWVASAGCYPRSYANSLQDITTEQWLKTAELMDKILEILNPLRTVASEKISMDDLGRLGQGSVSCSKRNPSAVCLYSFLYPVGRLDSEAFGLSSYSKYQVEKITRIIEDAKTPPAHLEMMKNYSTYLSELPSYYSDNDWGGITANIDAILSDLATSEGMFSDLGDDSAAQDRKAPGKEDNGDLNFDDLKLPE